MTYDACEKFVGPMPVNEFFEEFVPEAPTPRPKHNFSFSKPTVSQNEVEFVAEIRKSGLCPHLWFENTKSWSNKKTPYAKPDISAFLRPPDPSDQPKQLDWGLVELWIENKPKEGDFFIDVEQLRKHANSVVSHVGFNRTAYEVCGQLIAYASDLHRHQFRVFSFSIALFGKSCRLLRWDRGGVIYTESFNWEDGPFFEFLWRFNHLSAVDRGHDTTVSPVEDAEAEVALPRLWTYPKLEELNREQLHKILVWDDRAPDEKPKSYIAAGPKWATDALIGRATFGYIAYDMETGNLVYLKDFWRVDHPEIQKEGDVYRELHEAEVPNIATMGRAGDVHMIREGSRLQDGGPLGLQRTRTFDYLGRGDTWLHGRPQVEPYIHYRLVLETVGVPLNRFRSTRQLCEVIRDAVVAHSAAYNKTRILHRDVSAGNILITDKGTGILIDWDLSKKVKEDGDSKPRRHSRTGTWQFISIARLVDPSSRPHQVSDDLESFFWVLLYEVVRYRNIFEGNLKAVMQAVFDQHWRPDDGGIVMGGKGKLACLNNNELGARFLKRFVKTPCRDIIEEMRSLFHNLYLLTEPGLTSQSQSELEEEEPLNPQTVRVEAAQEKLRTSDAFLAIVEKHLASEWSINDDGSLDLTDPRVDPSASRNRKKRTAAEMDDSENIHVTRRGRMPPKRQQKSLDMLSSQTSYSSYRHSTLFSAAQKLATSSSAPSSRSIGQGLGLGNDGLPTKP